MTYVYVRRVPYYNLKKQKENVTNSITNNISKKENIICNNDHVLNIQKYYYSFLWASTSRHLYLAATRSSNICVHKQLCMIS